LKTLSAVHIDLVTWATKLLVDQELILCRYLSCGLLKFSWWGDALQKSSKLRGFRSDRDEICQECSSSKIIRIDWRSRIFDKTSYFQNGGNDVRPPISAAYAPASPAARRTRVTSLARCICPKKQRRRIKSNQKSNIF